MNRNFSALFGCNLFSLVSVLWIGIVIFVSWCSVQSNSAVAVAETVQHFITAMDSLKLNMVAVDQVRYLIS